MDKSQTELFMGDKLVIASSSVLTSTEDTLKLTLYKDTKSELVFVFDFTLTDKTLKGKEQVEVENIGDNGAIFHFTTPYSKTAFVRSSAPLAHSEEDNIYASFSIHSSSGKQLMFYYTFYLEQIKKQVAPKKTKSKGK
jgi:hypothetical protein